VISVESFGSVTKVTCLLEHGTEPFLEKEL
jgi:hypothetical protein